MVTAGESGRVNDVKHFPLKRWPSTRKWGHETHFGDLEDC